MVRTVPCDTRYAGQVVKIFLRVVRIGELGQFLQADALAVLAVAADAGEIVRPGAAVEQLLADPEGLDLLGWRSGAASFMPFDSPAT